MSISKTYTVVLEPMEGGGFLVRVPALPEVVTSGVTEAEALRMARDAIALVLESRKERGEPIPDEPGKPALREVTVLVAA